MRLRHRYQFKRMAHASISFAGKWIIVKVRPNKSQLPQLGITVTKRYGKSNLRNRFKRMVREAFRLSKHNFFTPLDILVLPRTSALNANAIDIQKELLYFMKKAMAQLESTPQT